jgi:hypothetical protein
MKSLPVSISRSSDVVLTEMGDGTGVLLNMRTKFYYTLNTTGVFVWKTLEAGTSTVDAISEALHAHFEVEIDTARADTRRVVEELLDEELIVG